MLTLTRAYRHTQTNKQFNYVSNSREGGVRTLSKLPGQAIAQRKRNGNVDANESFQIVSIGLTPAQWKRNGNVTET